MAGRPSRPRCAPVHLLIATWAVAVLGLAVGCNRTEDPPPAPAAAQEASDAGRPVEAAPPPRGEPAPMELYDPSTPPDPRTGEKYMYNLTTRSLTVYGRSRPRRARPNRAAAGQGGAVAYTEGEADVAYMARALLTAPADSPGPDTSAERYQHFEDNPFKAVRGTDAMATLSTAVDTASYANVRARLAEGLRPKPDAVRVADFVNYFPYAYAPPKGDAPAALHLELAPCPWQPKHHLLRLGVQAKSIDKDRLPARNLVFLIDTSGSMQEANRLPLVQESLSLLVEQLTGRDRVSIVTYAGDAGLRLPPTPGDQREKILEVVRGLSAGGSTNGEGGIRVAYEQAGQTFLKDGINRVILATDGDFNVGVSDPAELVRLIEAKRKTGVYLTVLGFGMGNLQDATLEQLARHWNGHYAYIDTIDEARKLFVEQGGALVAVAKDVKLQVEFNPARVSAYRLIGYENRLLRAEDFRDDAKDAGDMGSGHTCTVLFEVVPVGEQVKTGEVEPLKYQTAAELTAAAKAGEWLTARMRYKHPETDRAAEVGAVLPPDGLAKEASADLRFAAAAAAFGMILRDSPYRGDADHDKVIAWATPAIGPDPGKHRAEFVRLVDRAKSASEPKAEKE